MASSTISLRIDSDLKQSAEELFDDIGLTMTSAITLFLKTAVNSDGIPFDIKRTVPNPATEAAIKEYEKMKNKNSGYKRYDSFDDLMDEAFADA